MKKKTSENKIRLLWTGRFIQWKRIFDVLELAIVLKDLKIDFQLDILGGGVLQEKVESFIKDRTLTDYVNIVGNVPFDKVRNYMESANIFIMTSNQEEGWGAVVNEAMNSGCVVLGSNLAGSVPYLIKDGESGFIYTCGDVQEISQKVVELISNPSAMETIGKNAYHQIHDLWNADIAAERLLMLIDALYDNNDTIFIEGPCSYAEIIDEGM